jgi:hypothetical protein
VVRVSEPPYLVPILEQGLEALDYLQRGGAVRAGRCTHQDAAG